MHKPFDQRLQLDVLQQEAVVSVFGINQLEVTLGDVLREEFLLSDRIEDITVDAQDQSGAGDGLQRGRHVASAATHVVLVHHLRQLVVRHCVETRQELLTL